MRGLRRQLGALVVVLGAAVAGLAYAAGSGRLDTGSLRDAVDEALREPRFWLRHAHFVGLEALRAEELWERSGVRPGTPLVDLEPEAVCRELKRHPRVAACRAARLVPDRIVVAIEERVPIAQDADSGLGVDAGGTRFPLIAGEASRLPSLRGVSALALPLLIAAREQGVALAEVEAPRRGELRARPRGADLVLRLGTDVSGSLRAWKSVSESGLVEEYGAREVDLRFPDEAVLRGIRPKGGG